MDKKQMQIAVRNGKAADTTEGFKIGGGYTLVPEKDSFLVYGEKVHGKDFEDWFANLDGEGFNTSRWRYVSSCDPFREDVRIIFAFECDGIVTCVFPNNPALMDAGAAYVADKNGITIILTGDADYGNPWLHVASICPFSEEIAGGMWKEMTDTGFFSSLFGKGCSFTGPDNKARDQRIYGKQFYDLYDILESGPGHREKKSFLRELEKLRGEDIPAENFLVEVLADGLITGDWVGDINYDRTLKPAHKTDGPRPSQEDLFVENAKRGTLEFVYDDGSLRKKRPTFESFTALLDGLFDTEEGRNIAEEYLNDDHDGLSADALLQLWVLGEIVFG